MLRKGILWAHKWLGLITGIVVFLVSLSGAIYCFQDDLKLLFYPDRFVLAHEGEGQTMPLSELIEIAQKHLPEGEKVSRVDLYPAKDRTWAFRAVGTDPQGFGLWNYFRYYKRVFLNPYTGEVAAVEDATKEFFQVSLELHMHLLLGKTYGGPIVTYATAIFVLMLLSGIVLWWPKNTKRKTLKRSFWFSRSAKRKRLNYDLHNVLGFYSFFVALLLSLTGLVFSFPLFQKAYVKIFNGMAESEAAQLLPSDPTYIPQVYPNTLDNTLYFLLEKYPEANMMSIRLRKADSPLVDVQVRMQEGRTSDFAWYYVEQDTHKIDRIVRSARLSGGDRLGALNYDIHTGSIAGFASKLLACLVSLFCASLPVTGTILWWHKTKGKRR